MRRLICALLLASLPVAGASATVVKEATGDKSGPETGGVDIGVPEGRVRLQCWQYGKKIIDEPAPGVTSLSLGAQSNAIGFGPPGEKGSTATLLSQPWTTCLLKRED